MLHVEDRVRAMRVKLAQLDANAACHSMTPTATAMAAVADHPSIRSQGPLTNLPMTFGLCDISIMVAMIGAERAPLTTAAQYKALIGSMCVKPRATPTSVDAAITL